MNDENITQVAALLRMLEEKENSSTQNTQYEKPNYASEEYINYLKSVSNSFLKKEKFTIGQIVRWKKNLQNRILPEEDQPAIVLQVLNEPLMDNNKESGSPYFQEPLDIVLGIIDRKNRFLTLYYDSSRFEVYDQC